MSKYSLNDNLISSLKFSLKNIKKFVNSRNISELDRQYRLVVYHNNPYSVIYNEIVDTNNIMSTQLCKIEINCKGYEQSDLVINMGHQLAIFAYRVQLVLLLIFSDVCYEITVANDKGIILIPRDRDLLEPYRK